MQVFAGNSKRLIEWWIVLWFGPHVALGRVRSKDPPAQHGRLPVPRKIAAGGSFIAVESIPYQPLPQHSLFVAVTHLFAPDWIRTEHQGLTLRTSNNILQR